MADKKTLLDKLREKNDDYHIAVNEIFRDDNLPVELKTAFGTNVHKVFYSMAAAEEIIKEHYELEE